MKIAIYYLEENKEIVELIKNESLRLGFSFDNENPDVVFSVGGDGTFLRAVHHYIDKLDSLTFVGINSGSLGFFYDFSKDDVVRITNALANQTCPTREYPLLKGEAIYKDDKKTFYALNEIRIENPFHTLISKVLVNQDELETFRGNGLIVSSSLGSSAYNKSLGGALIDSDLNALELTEIAGISNNVYRSLGSPLIIKGDKTITFTGDISGSVIGYDYLSDKDSEGLESLSISYSDKKVRIIYSNDHSYVQRIRKSFVK